MNSSKIRIDNGLYQTAVWEINDNDPQLSHLLRYYHFPEPLIVSSSIESWEIGLGDEVDF